MDLVEMSMRGIYGSIWDNLEMELKLKKDKIRIYTLGHLKFRFMDTV